MRRLLILSNNVLSETKNNGKTLYSFIKGQDVEVYQLYLSGEIPRIEGYKYFRITDKDIINGFCNKKNRGGTVSVDTSVDRVDDFSIKKSVGRNQFTLAIRDLLWHKRWKSEQLDSWLKMVSPDAVFFVAGDAIFAYEICEYIYSKYMPRLTIYVTDDYVMRRIRENQLHAFRRKLIIKAMRNLLANASCFYTISERMREEYKKIFGVDSNLIVNITDDLKDSSCSKHEPEIILTYAGSFYYQRSDVLIELAKAIKKYNESQPSKPAKLMLYSNKDPDNKLHDLICVEGASEYGGSLNSKQLRERLNTSDILVFVESFNPEQIEKVKYSLSTKVPEYISIGKPILAVGPKGIGSMDYLDGVAFCINSVEEIQEGFNMIVQDYQMQVELGKRAREKYITNFNEANLKKMFAENVLGISGAIENNEGN